MSFKDKIISIVLSVMVVVTFMPITGQIVFATESDLPGETPQDPIFSSSGVVAGLRVAKYNYKSVTIRWSAYEKAVGYQVYRATKKNGKYRLVRNTTGLSYYDKNNKVLGKYRYYKIRAYGIVEGNRAYTKLSRAFAAKPNLNAPIVKTSGSNKQIKVSWNKVPGATKYQVYRATSLKGKYKRVTTTKKKSYKMTSVTKSHKYYYKVRAKRYSRRGVFSKRTEGMTVLIAPTSVTAKSNTDEGIIVRWTGVKGASGYQVLRSQSFNGPFNVVPGASFVTGKNYVDKDKALKNGNTYYYKVRGVAKVNGANKAGLLSVSNQRDAAVAQAVAWDTAKESNGSHKKIVRVYNSATHRGKIGYRTAWCAAFVSAVAIKTGNTSVIPVDCYCPRMYSKYKSWNRSASRNYRPTGGDIIFFDWNNNRLADHVGMVYSYNSATKRVTTIEGNYKDAVNYRTFKRGWSDVLGYGLPKYKNASYKGLGTVKYSYTSSKAISNSVGDDPVKAGEVETAIEAVEEATPSVSAETTDSDKSAETKVIAGAQSSQEATESINLEENQESQPQEIQQPLEDQESQSQEIQQPLEDQESQDSMTKSALPKEERDTVDALMDYIAEEKPAEGSPAEESTFNAFLMFEACDDAGIDACVITQIGPDGEERSYNEIMIDGERYLVDATKEGSKPIKYIPEGLN